ncbi:MAG: trigger factor, partial [Myxococcales bacterium]|nr:trigger factor [Myxococcales bacterium]
SVRRRVQFEVPSSKVDSAFSKFYNQIGQRARLPGFRQGKVPLGHLRKRYQSQAISEVGQQLVEEGWKTLLDDHEIVPVSRPEVDAGAPREGHAFSFTVTFEIAPDIELQAYESLSIEREVYVASPDVVEHELEHVAEHFTRFEPIEDRTDARDGDQVVIDYRGEIDEIPFPGGTAQDAELHLGSGQFIPGFEGQIVGHEVGESFAIQVSFPEQYGAPNLAGKEATFHITLKALRQQVVPEIGQPLADLLGEPDLDAVRARTKAEIEARFNRRSDEEARTALRAQIGAAYDFDAPPSLVDDEVLQRQNQLAREMIDAGMPAEEAKAQALDQGDALRDEAITEVRAALVLDAIAEKESIEVAPREVDSYIEFIVRQTGQYGARLREAYRDPNRRAGLRRRMRETKVLDFLLTKANVTSVEKAVPAHKHDHDHDHDHDHGPTEEAAE